MNLEFDESDTKGVVSNKNYQKSASTFGVTAQKVGGMGESASTFGVTA